MTQPLRKILLAILLSGLAGCAGLPEYAAPKQVAIEYDESTPRDSIAYRSLFRKDFRGLEPPPQFDERMAAVTCAHIEPLIDREGIVIREAVMKDGSQGYHITLRNLKFRALLDRSCSWWNPAVSSLEEDYILQHEQIHFALFEVAAREWTEAPPLELRIKAGNRNEMLEKMREQFERHLDQRMAVLMELNREFDEQTSVGYDPEKQEEWWDQVQTQLADTRITGEKIVVAAAARELADAAESADLADESAVANSGNRDMEPCPTLVDSVWDNCFGTYLQPKHSEREGDKYIGEFKDDTFHGRGTYYFLADGEWHGDMYVGEFKHGKFDGYGVYTFANGDIQEGLWENNEFLEEQSEIVDGLQ